MIVTSLKEIASSERDVDAGQWRSRRLVLAEDGAGFSLHDTLVRAGAQYTLHYTSHIEAVYCIEGEGELVDESTGHVHRLEPGSLYLLNDHDRHTLRAKTAMRTVCVFNPACTGQEVHDENGAYPAPE
ncbi:ectoine synthase [Actinokineospora sp. UTMC 2448]|uniref:ectoine synthase n=1 Tax=Actinokineospora sp. UTMC 2448 TaxID=2268449 RepID=UPI002164CBFC|nr:ectoine synthase [Actinokineospora sp. UTMC 2448]UVS79500.1 L-ectoine synthase [Actinokineospora sp. UTMC 2448]